MNSILITGINGFLGSHIAKKLKNEYNIIGLEDSLDNLFRISNDNFKIYSSSASLESIFKENKIQIIIHTATIYRRNNTVPIENLINTNISLPVSLLQFAENYDCKLFINTDTFFNNQECNYSYLPDYTLSKKQTLEWLKLISQRCRLVNMKIFQMYGPNDSPDKFVPTIIKQLKNNQLYIKTTLGAQTRDFIFIDDVVNAFKCLVRHDNGNDTKYLEYEVGTGISTSIKDFILTAKKVIQSSSKIHFGALPYRENEIMISMADNINLVNIGWSVEYTIPDGVKML